MSQIFLPVMLWPPEVQDNFHFMKHNSSGKGGNCRWTIPAGKKQQLWQHEENYVWKVPKLARTVIVKWCRQNAARCIVIFVKLKTCGSTACSKRRLPRAPLCTHMEARAVYRRSVSFQGCLEHLLVSQDQREIQAIKRYTVLNFKTIFTGWKNVDQR